MNTYSREDVNQLLNAVLADIVPSPSLRQSVLSAAAKTERRSLRRWPRHEQERAEKLHAFTRIFVPLCAAVAACAVVVVGMRAITAGPKTPLAEDIPNTGRERALEQDEPQPEYPQVQGFAAALQVEDDVLDAELGSDTPVPPQEDAPADEAGADEAGADEAGTDEAGAEEGLATPQISLQATPRPTRTQTLEASPAPGAAPSSAFTAGGQGQGANTPDGVGSADDGMWADVGENAAASAPDAGSEVESFLGFTPPYEVYAGAAEARKAGCVFTEPGGVSQLRLSAVYKYAQGVRLEYAHPAGAVTVWVAQSRPFTGKEAAQEQGVTIYQATYADNLFACLYVHGAWYAVQMRSGADAESIVRQVVRGLL